MHQKCLFSERSFIGDLTLQWDTEWCTPRWLWCMHKILPINIKPLEITDSWVKFSIVADLLKMVQHQWLLEENPALVPLDLSDPLEDQWVCLTLSSALFWLKDNHHQDLLEVCDIVVLVHRIGAFLQTLKPIILSLFCVFRNKNVIMSYSWKSCCLCEDVGWTYCKM